MPEVVSRKVGALVRRGLAAAVVACGLGLALPAANAVAAVAAAEPALARGNELFAAGEYAAARDAFTEALEADPSSVEAHLGRARSYYAMGEYARAVSSSRQSLATTSLPSGPSSRPWTRS